MASAVRIAIVGSAGYGDLRNVSAFVRQLGRRADIATKEVQLLTTPAPGDGKVSVTGVVLSTANECGFEAEICSPDRIVAEADHVYVFWTMREGTAETTAIVREAMDAGKLVKVCAPTAADLSRDEPDSALSRLLA